MGIGNGIQVEFDNDWLEQYQIEHVVISQIVTNMGAVVASTNNNDLLDVIVFQIQMNETADSYAITSEIASFNFFNEESKHEFLQHLPEMSAMDLIFLLNSNHFPLYN